MVLGTAFDIGKTAGAAQTVLGGSSVFSSFGRLASAANPYIAGFQAITSLFGGQKVNVSKASSGGEARSGEAAFFGKNNIGNSAVFDLGNPIQAAILAAGVVGAIYVYKKYMR